MAASEEKGRFKRGDKIILGSWLALSVMVYLGELPEVAGAVGVVCLLVGYGCGMVDDREREK